MLKIEEFMPGLEGVYTSAFPLDQNAFKTGLCQPVLAPNR
jgi:hypothetical protein